jgi:putative membrane protein
MSYLDDPRVLFAAERTLLAWQRSSIALMALGFLIERFGLFVKFAHPDSPVNDTSVRISAAIGVAFILMGCLVLAISGRQFQRFEKRLSPKEIPEGYRTIYGPLVSYVIAVAGVVLASWLAFFGPR